MISASPEFGATQKWLTDNLPRLPGLVYLVIKNVRKDFYSLILLKRTPSFHILVLSGDVFCFTLPHPLPLPSPPFPRTHKVIPTMQRGENKQTWRKTREVSVALG